jgi:hypothetical protein
MEANTHAHTPKPPRPDSYSGQRDFMILFNWLFSIDIFLAPSANIPTTLQVTYVANCQDSMVLDGDKRQALIGPD